jgi:serine/threonine protein kinase
MDQKGGKFYGEGMKGYVEDAPCIKDDHKTFCKYFTDNQTDIAKVSLYNVDLKHIDVKEPSEITNILNMLKEAKTIVAKTFKGNNPVEPFKNELKASKIIASTLPNPDYHTIAPAFIYKKVPVYGMVIEYESAIKSKSFHIFSEGCSTQILNVKFDQKLFNKFVNDIKEGFDVIHKAGIYHNDVKPDNMIFCPKSNRFKIIDWELASFFPKKPINFRKCGTTLFNHPLKFYLGGLPSVIAKRLIEYSLLLGKHKWVSKCKSYPLVKAFAQTSFEHILSIHADKTKLQIHKLYAKFYDNYAFALTIILLADKHKLNVPKELIDDLLAPFIPNLFVNQK